MTTWSRSSSAVIEEDDTPEAAGAERGRRVRREAVRAPCTKAFSDVSA
jgi:hypothetical protein